ncbi:hypothetical protein IKF67_02350 [Candidatus Saccharibacteria bacterium]|nr:hypothetical protein [Candidatus Saccharibacteria bacterium]
MDDVLDEKKFKKTLLIDAKAVGIPVGAAEIFIDKSIKDAKKALKTKKIITENDLERTVSRELKKYNADLAYVFKNRDKII